MTVPVSRLAEAATLEERLRGQVICVPTAMSSVRLSRWRDMVLGPEAGVEGLVGGSGVDQGELERVLGTAHWPPDRELPGWVHRLLGLVSGMVTDSGGELSPDPFVDIIWPLVDSASSEIEDRLDGPGFGPGVRTGLQSHLARTLLFATAQVLAREFTLYCHLHRTPWERFEHQSARSGHDLYRAFRRSLLEDRFSGLLAAYPALARVWAEIVIDWQAGAAALLDRVDRDRADLADRLGVVDCGRLLELTSARSDRHSGGQVVWLLRFDAGGCVYKPRDLTLEHAWHSCLAWLNRQQPPAAVRPLWVCCRDGYGWEELVEPAPCPDRAAVTRYYERAGALLCLVQLLAGGDCHRENVVSAGEHPVIVDLETLLSPRPARTAPASAAVVAQERLTTSVLASGLLPHWSPAGAADGLDGGGLDDGGDEPTMIRFERWRRDWLDGVRLEAEPLALPLGANVVSVDGAGPTSAGANVDHIISGYRRTYRFVAERRDALLAEWSRARGTDYPVRRIRRPTVVYARLLWSSLGPDALRSGVDRHLVLEALRSPAMPQHLEEAAVQAEQRSLRRLDIPYFTVTSTSRNNPGTAGNSGWQEMQRRVAGMSAADETQQAELIAMAYLARGHAIELRARPRGEPPSPGSLEERPVDGSELQAAAGKLADLVCAAAVRGSGGSVTWIVPDIGTSPGTFGVRVMGPSLYSGLAGPGLFLAAAAALLGEPRWAAAARSVARSLAGADPRAERSLGGVMGVGSVVWCLTWMGSLLRDEPMLAEAGRWASAISDESIEHDDQLDLASGAAGCILGLLRLHEATGESRPLERAETCAEHVLSRRSGRPAAWPNRAGIRLAGLAHGASGVAHALLRLDERSGSERLRAAAVDAFHYERTLFDADRGNWRDLRPDVPAGAFMTAWCNGAGGIGLVRARWSRAFPSLAPELDDSVRTTLDHVEGGVDHLCCGALGRSGLLLAAGLQRGDDHLMARARDRATAAVRRLEATGKVGVSSSPAINVQHAGFFRGISGVGYQMLRLARPDSLPDVLLLE